MKLLTSVGLLVVGLVASLLFGSSDCAPQQQGRNSKYVVGELSSGRVGTVEINSDAASNARTTSSANFANYQRQQQVQSSPRVVMINQSQPAQQFTPQRVQSVTVQPQQQQSQYERELAQYQQALMVYQQQMVASQPQIQTRIYQPQQYVQPQQYQPQPYQPQPYQPQPYQPQPYQPQPYQPQPYQPQPSPYQSFSPYAQPNYYSMPFGMSSRPSSSSSLLGSLSDGFRSLTSGFGLGSVGLGLFG
ncbi:uncharacterized protein LOC126562963 [Anopheles maculipalpis]|uniref:uncharacterized protein LOC126562963 n=1 Tax=Anopheles maculipalpis TaxID=1496333 RepID=UPI002159B0C0|nr:uncharacterized protein LOC126562963 [Anopheles maculipalpis]